MKMVFFLFMSVVWWMRFAISTTQNASRSANIVELLIFAFYKLTSTEKYLQSNLIIAYFVYLLHNWVLVFVNKIINFILLIMKTYFAQVHFSPTFSLCATIPKSNVIKCNHPYTNHSYWTFEFQTHFSNPIWLWHRYTVSKIGRKITTMRSLSSNNSNTITLPRIGGRVGGAMEEVSGAQDTIYLCNFRVSVDGEWLCLKELQDLDIQDTAGNNHNGDGQLTNYGISSDKSEDKNDRDSWVHYCRCLFCFVLYITYIRNTQHKFRMFFFSIYPTNISSFSYFINLFYVQRLLFSFVLVCTFEFFSIIFIFGMFSVTVTPLSICWVLNENKYNNLNISMLCMFPFIICLYGNLSHPIFCKKNGCFIDCSRSVCQITIKIW